MSLGGCSSPLVSRGGQGAGQAWMAQCASRSAYIKLVKIALHCNFVVARNVILMELAVARLELCGGL